MSDAVWTVRDILKWTSEKFAAQHSETPLLDAQLLLAHILKVEKVQLYVQLDRPLSEAERSAMRVLVQRKLKGEPVAYILGHKYWHDLQLFVDSRVLIPRPETETLLDFVFALCSSAAHTPLQILDLCTGSGCLGIALAKKFPGARVVAVDISQDALDVAAINASENGVAERIEFVLGDVAKPELFVEFCKKYQDFSVVVANPPYVSEKEWSNLAVSVRDFEPKLALVAADEGLALAKHIVKNLTLSCLLGADSVFAMELGADAPTVLGKALSESFLPPFSAQYPVWDMPRHQFFPLRDLDSVDRFLCQINGLVASLPNEPL